MDSRHRRRLRRGKPSFAPAVAWLTTHGLDPTLKSIRDVYAYLPEWGLPSAADRATLIEIMTTHDEQGDMPPPRQSPRTDRC